MKKMIAIIGAGNMGRAIAQGLLDKKVITNKQLLKTTSQTKNNKEATQKADVIILTIKPQVIKDVLYEIRPFIQKKHLIISIVAGITMNTIELILGKDKSIVRAMPNLAARTGNSMTGWIANSNVNQEQLEISRNIFQAIGQEIQLEKELQLNAVTAISGSGPAYFFYIIELLEDAGKKFGLSEEVSSRLATQTAMGTASLLQNTSMSAHEFRNSVTSKGGTTEAALSKFEENNFGEIFQEGVQAAEKRAEELNK